MLTPSVPAVQNGKVFLVLRGELLNRLDPSPYKSNFYFKSKRYSTKKLSEIAFIDPKVTFNKVAEDTYVSFIPMDAIDDENGIVTKCLSKNLNDTKGFTRFQENDLIWAKITPCMQNGKSAVVRNLLHGYGCGSTEFFVIRPKTTDVLVDYFHVLLRDKRILETAQNFFGGSAGQQRVSKTFLENFPVPVPPLEIQRQIVQKMEAAYASKRAKEAEAAQLLAGIDGYLLEQLGIRLPEVGEKKKTFFVCSDKVSGGRLDPFYFANQHYKIEGGIYENKSLRQVANLDKGQSITKDSIVGGKFPVIAGGQTSPYSHENYNQEANVITVSASGAYAGYVWFHDYPIFASDCTVIRSKDESEISTLFLSEVLKLKQKEIYNMQQGAGQPHVYASDLAKLMIPIPNSEIQKRISAHITAIRLQAQQLESAAKAAVEAAKKEVEAMILG